LPYDTGGVRLQEANAGELSISEIINGIIEARVAIAVVALIDGRAGAFGGGSIIIGCA
jgi:malonate decarboxylase beta subunit